MGKAIDLVEQLIAGALPDEAILANLKADMIKRRADSKLNQQSNFSAMQRYVFYGPEFIRRTTLDNPSLEALTSPELLSKVRELMGKQHEVLYYGPMSEKEFTATLAEHHKTAPSSSRWRRSTARRSPPTGPRWSWRSTTPSSSTTCSTPTAANCST